MSRMQEQRYELKYWIHEHTAARVRDYVQQYLLLDPFGVNQPNLSYPVCFARIDKKWKRSSDLGALAAIEAVARGWAPWRS